MLVSSEGPTFSPEIISEIIGYLHDDKKTLRTLGFVSKHTLHESRHHLFSTVDFLAPLTGNAYDVWQDFDRFLRLVDVAWTSFTPAIQCIRFLGFYGKCADHHSIGRGIPLARIRTNLLNVKSLRLGSLNLTSIPSYILDLVFQLPIEHLSLGLVYGCNATNLLDLFRRFPPLLRTLDFNRMKFPSTLRLCLLVESSVFHRPFRFETLDSRSLLLFQSVWDPFCYNIDIKVKSFWLQLEYDQLYPHEALFISRFLQRIGSSLENLKISHREYDPWINGFLDPIHVSQCINLRSLEIEELKWDDREDQVPDSAVQKFLSALPSPRLVQEISIEIAFSAQMLERRLIMLLKWSSLIETVQRLFPNLNKLAISIGTRLRAEDPNPYLDLLRRVGNVRDLEKKGVIKLDVIISHSLYI
ncbi:hypothetical protein M378DRAFT_9486 [Amanita muscaria Koide BX008]|uniref:F-box domain-containing protein n=1 Tax=Amanita muscaria (strain Koide BX008) TaxID=946122 RepID=A0A0C2SUX9_AMAMK|nr:hypothetical protein M378DRAFT_9486 [Amanita muscaria Koide BX008]